MDGSFFFWSTPGLSSLLRNTFQFLFIAKMVGKKITLYSNEGKNRFESNSCNANVENRIYMGYGNAIGQTTKWIKIVDPEQSSTIHEHKTYWNLNMHFAFDSDAITWGEIHKSCFRLSKTKVTSYAIGFYSTFHDSGIGVHFTATCWTPCGSVCIYPMMGSFTNVYSFIVKYFYSGQWWWWCSILPNMDRYQGLQLRPLASEIISAKNYYEKTKKMLFRIHSGRIHLILSHS